MALARDLGFPPEIGAYEVKHIDMIVAKAWEDGYPNVEDLRRRLMYLTSEVKTALKNVKFYNPYSRVMYPLEYKDGKVWLISAELGKGEPEKSAIAFRERLNELMRELCGVYNCEYYIDRAWFNKTSVINVYVKFL